MASRIAIAKAGATCLDKDWEKTQELLKGLKYEVGACNEAAIHHEGPLRLWASLHPEKLPGWIARRKKVTKWPVEEITAHKTHPRLHHPITVQPDVNQTLTSGGYLVLSLLRRGYTRIILCGMPMDARSNMFHSTEKNWAHADMYWKNWVPLQQDLSQYVRSYSGRTRDAFGEPTWDWVSS